MIQERDRLEADLARQQEEKYKAIFAQKKELAARESELNRAQREDRAKCVTQSCSVCCVASFERGGCRSCVFVCHSRLDCLLQQLSSRSVAFNSCSLCRLDLEKEQRAKEEHRAKRVKFLLSQAGRRFMKLGRKLGDQRAQAVGFAVARLKKVGLLALACLSVAHCLLVE